MRTIVLAGRVVLIVCLSAGCSSKNPNAPQDSAQHLGTPVVAAGVVDRSTTLLWSEATDELVCTGSFTLGSPGSLIAIRRSTGAVRTLDSTTSIPIGLAPDGSAAYYNALRLDFSEFGVDTIEARRIALGGGAARLRLASCEGFCVHLIAPAPDGDQVAIRSLGMDSIRVYRLGSGTSRAVGEGVPIVFSPSSSQLLALPLPFEGLNSANIVTLATGMTEPAGFVVPDPIGGYRLRWDAQGLAALYVSGQKNLHRVFAGQSPTLVWTSPDSIYSKTWSPSGQLAAVWTSRSLEGAPTASRIYELFVVDMMSRAVRVAFAKVASAATPLPTKTARFRAMVDIFPDDHVGGMAFTLGEAEIAYVFDGRVYRSPTMSPVSASTR